MNSLRPLARKPVTTAPGQPLRQLRSPAAKRETCTTATLERGRVYFYKNIPFERGEPLAIDAALCKRYGVDIEPTELIQDLEELFEEVTDSDNEQFAKPIFDVKRNQPRPATPEEKAQAARPRRVRQFVDWKPNTEEERPRPRTVGLRR